MSDVRGGRVYTADEIDLLLANNAEEQLCINFLGETCWTEFGIYDVFEDSAKRASPEEYTNEAVLVNMKLTSGSTASMIYGWTSEIYNAPILDDIKKIVAISNYSTAPGGYTRLKVSVNGGTDYTTIVDTKLAIDKRHEEVVIPVSERGKIVKTKLEVENDISGNGATTDYYGLIF